MIILGSGLHGDQVPPLLAARIDKAIEVANAQNPPAVLVPSGGKGSDETVAEGVAMARYLRDKGIPEDRILVEDKARNTEENILYSVRLIGDPDATLTIVTSSYHVFRAALLTRHLGIKALVRGAKTAPYYVPSAFIGEFIAVLRDYRRYIFIFPIVWTLFVIIASIAAQLLLDSALFDSPIN